jgi:integrase
MPKRSVRNFRPFANPGNTLDPAHGKQRPAKPSPDFPLFPHGNGQWAKKVRGRLVYFGPWEGPGAALAKYLAEKDDLHAGRHPRPTPEAVTVKDVCNAYLNAKQARVDSGELSARTWMDGKEACDLIVGQFGRQRLVSDLRADDFNRLRARMARRWGPVRLGNVINRVKGVFKHGLESGLIDRPVCYGPEFRRPSAGVLRRHRASNGEKMFEAPALRELIGAAPAPLKAMVLLGVNAGFGNNDVASLPLSALDLDRGWINFPRPKTGIARRCPLWPESVEAIREALASRPAPGNSADAQTAFLMSSGRRWVRVTEKSRTDNLSVVFAALLKKVGAYREGVSFYTLRHVFRTVADEVRDPVAIDLIMGHADTTMAGHYRERISDDRLKAVSDRVHRWLFADQDPSKVGTA